MHFLRDPLTLILRPLQAAMAHAAVDVCRPFVSVRSSVRPARLVATHTTRVEIATAEGDVGTERCPNQRFTHLEPHVALAGLASRID